MILIRNLISKFSAKRAALGAGATTALVGLSAGSAFAVPNPDADTVTAVTGATGTLTDTIHAAVPLILGVTVVMVVLGLGKRLIRKAG